MLTAMITIGIFAVLAIVAAPKFLSTYIPIQQDANLVLKASGQITQTTSETALDLGSGFAPGGIGMPIAVGVQITAIDRTTGDETYTWQIEESADNSSFTAAGLISGAKTAVGAFSLGAFISQRYVRITATLGGTSPIVTYSAWMSPCA